MKNISNDIGSISEGASSRGVWDLTNFPLGVL